MSEAISSFRSLRAESKVFGQEPAVAMHLPFGMLCLSAISMKFVKILLAVCMLVGMMV